MCNNPKQVSGFTLLELMVVIGIVGILMAMAVPSFRDMMRNTRLTTYANEFVTSLNVARSEAIKRGVPVTVGKIATAGSTTHWGTSGWRIFVDIDKDGVIDKTEDANDNGILDSGEDTNGNGVLDGDYKLREYAALPAVFTLMGNGTTLVNRITYLADGSINNTPGSFVLCDNSDGNGLVEPYTARLIIVNMTGRIQMGRDTNGDGRPEKNDGSTLTSCTP